MATRGPATELERRNTLAVARLTRDHYAHRIARIVLNGDQVPDELLREYRTARAFVRELEA